MTMLTVGRDDSARRICRLHILTSGAPGSSRPTQLLSRVIAALKRFTNREAGQSLWQTSYYDHVIRNEADAFRVREYMENNPARWQEDRYYTADLP